MKTTTYIVVSILLVAAAVVVVQAFSSGAVVSEKYIGAYEQLVFDSPNGQLNVGEYYIDGKGVSYGVVTLGATTSSATTTMPISNTKGLILRTVIGVKATALFMNSQGQIEKVDMLTTDYDKLGSVDQTVPTKTETLP